MCMADKISEGLKQKVLSGEATLQETEEYQRKTDLQGLPGFGTYQKESNFTRQWSCPQCGGPIPCSIDCPQCGKGRPDGNADPDQEGYMGHNRAKAGYRKK